MTSRSRIGLSTYAYFWRFSERVAEPMSLADMMRDAARLGSEVFQICDYAPLDAMTADDLADVKNLADQLDLALEIGTRGTNPEHLQRYLELAKGLGAGLVRSMWTSGDDRPALDESVRRLRAVMPGYEDSGVTLALETYEQVSTADLVTLVETVDSPRLGICLDPANTVARLELPDDVTSRCLPHVVNWHVKDFDFTRQVGWVGFSLVGVPLGEGRLDYDGMQRDLDPARRGINQIVEHWLPWQGDPETTIRREAEWTTQNLEILRSKNHD
ncbi:MAG: Sugar phosphate isomerase [Frondihabitans sp.]|nr:Sugar phosphate isomerase [Frondihabitans sp.]